MLHPWLKIRILPVTMAMAMLFLGMKINQIVEGKERLQDVVVSRAIAEETESEETEETQEGTEEEATEESAEKEEEAEDKESSAGEEAAEGAEEEGETEESAAKPEEKREYNQIELDILQSLSSRREEIEQWAEEVQVREQVLEATEIRIDDKLEKMQALKAEVETLLKEYKKEEQTELRSLVKIYESMKPKDAARIFDELDMDILLDVVDLMSERKAAPILAGMDPKRAKDLTVELAERRRLQGIKAQDMVME